MNEKDRLELQSWCDLYHERLRKLCGPDPVTENQIRLAMKEADAITEKLEKDALYKIHYRDIKLHPEEIAHARALSDIIGQTSTLNTRSNFTEVEAPDRYFTGYVCEFAVLRLLRDVEKRACDHNVRADGKSQKSSDIGVFCGGIRKKLEVKGAGKPTHRLFAVNVKQHEANVRRGVLADFFVGARIESFSTVRVWGWLPLKIVERLKIKDVGEGGQPAYQCQLENLYPIETLISQLDPEKTVDKIPVEA